MGLGRRAWHPALADPLLPHFLALFALRRRYLRAQSQALYKRYGQALGIALAFFGLVLVERPTLLAAPILHFWGDPGNWQAGLAYLGGWLFVVGLWARVHRGFVRGGAFADFARTSSQGQRVGSALDLALVLVALQWCAIPFAIAAWTVATDAAPGGAPGVAPGIAAGRFWACFLVLLLLTVASARAVVFGAGRMRCLRLGGAFALLLCAGLPASGVTGVLLALGAAALLLVDLARPSSARAAHRHDSGATGVLRGPGMFFLLQLQWRALRRAHLHVAAPRIGLALLLHAACWWMIYSVGKHHDAAAFIKLACCLSAYALAGLYYAFWETRQAIAPFLRSLPFGTAKAVLAENLVVLGVAAAVFALAWLGYRYAVVDGPDMQAWLLRCAGLSMLLLALLGAPILQRHPHGVAFKVALCVAALMLM
jgi:hypothetical protein